MPRRGQARWNNPTTQREGPGGWGKPTQGSTVQRAQAGSQGKSHTSPCLASFGQQWKAGPATEAPEMIPGSSRALLAVKGCWEGHSEAAAEIDKSNTAKAWRTAQRHTEPIDAPKTYYWTLHCPFRERRSSSISQERGTSSPIRKTSQDTNPTPSSGADSTTKKNCNLENFFFSYKSHCLVPRQISTFTLAFCSAIRFFSLFFLLEKIHSKIVFLFFVTFSPFFFVCIWFFWFCSWYTQLLFL